MNRTILILISFTLTLGACGPDLVNGAGVIKRDKEILFLDPLQCLENPWEKDYIKSKGKSYPTGNPIVIEPIEKTIIVGFFFKGLVEIDSVWSKTFEEEGLSPNVCEACTCPQGYRLYVRTVGNNDNMTRYYNFKKHVKTDAE